jgi:cobalt-zinc-cadmium resistance protein CzcA
VLVIAPLLIANGAFLTTQLGAEFVPRLREGSLVINTVRLAGVSLDESVRYSTHIERHLLEKFPDEIEMVWTRTGTAEVATDPMGLEVSDVFLTLTPREEWMRAETQDELVEEISGELEGMPGMRAVYMQPIEMRVNEMVAGIRADVGVKLFGDDFDQLREKAAEIARVVEGIEGAADVTVEQVTGLPLLQVEVDREAAARFGIDADQVLAVVESMGTRIVGEVREEGMRFDLAVTLPDAYREDPERLGRILVTAPGGERVPLSRLATVRVEEGPSTIQREWQKRRITVQSNVRGRDVASFVAEVQETVASRIELPPGWYVRYGGQFEHLERARERLYIVVPLALLLIAGLLYVTYRRWSDVAAVFVSVPFAVVGGVVALWLRGIPFSISAAVGFIALSGVAVLGEMVLVSRLRQLLDDGLAAGDAVREAAISRIRPVLMTALVASFGFLPMALNTGLGAEVQRPLATVVIGGIVTSTLTTLLIFPVLYRALVLRRAS